jgi:glycosyltransferase involved in cell wall biosynthesis
MKLSALIVTCNDDKHLEECFTSLRRFDELVVVDLESSDRSVEIAQKLGINVIPRRWVPTKELIVPDIVQLPRNDWILRVDPDEVLSPALVDELLDLEIGKDYGMVAIPFQYYFLNKKLDTTVWGGMIYGTRLFHREKSYLEPQVHRSQQCKEGFKILTIEFKGNNAVAHYWVDSYSQLFSKHERYLTLEGESRFSKGERYSWKKLVKHTWRNFKASFIDKSGWRGGWAGWFLSFYYAQYEARGWLSLWQYEQTQARKRL